MLLYIIEAAVPLLTILLVWAATLALKGNHEKHKTIALSHAAATWASYVVVIALVRLGQSIGGDAPKWIVDVHLVIIYMIPPALVALMLTGLKKRTGVHRWLAFGYAITWSAALVTGGMIFLMSRGLL